MKALEVPGPGGGLKARKRLRHPVDGGLIPAFRFGEKTADPLQMYLADVMTVAANLAGVPALSQCCGFTRAGLPIGLQVLGPPLGEEAVFRVAGAYEARTDWHRRLPPDPVAVPARGGGAS